MKKHPIRCLGVAMLATALAACQTTADQEPQSDLPNVDFSGVEAFLELTAQLERDEEPTAEQWDDLFATPGYAVLLQSEFRREFFVERFKLAFMPSQQDALAKQLQEESGFVAQFLRHYVRAKEQREEVQTQVARLRSLEFVEEAVRRSQSFLPESAADVYPPISFVIFGPDARGYTPVVIDVLHSIDAGEFLTSFVAHEFHHYYRNRLFDYSQERDIVWVIDQIQAEGIADQINVGEWFHDPGLYERRSASQRNRDYLEWYRKSPEIITQMDVLFSQMLRHPERKPQLGSELRQIVPLSGHPTGFYMANTIIEQLGRDALIEVVGNPFSFFLLYKRAADKTGGIAPSFSDESVQFITQLQKRYLE